MTAFSRGGGKTYYLPKNIIFSFKKSPKHTILAGRWGGGEGGKGPLLALPCRRPWRQNNTIFQYKNVCRIKFNFKKAKHFFS